MRFATPLTYQLGIDVPGSSEAPLAVIVDEQKRDDQFVKKCLPSNRTEDVKVVGLVSCVYTLSSLHYAQQVVWKK
ncbi:unnamed protein product [Allacma fusca]|uniref:Uncharacterized protein n=1 Tax=Allacma fusca TaxID=39272 RepID=A0A8J2L3A6_9HEXA|nr:unnamed protein product [Allacma fusca]